MGPPLESPTAMTLGSAVNGDSVDGIVDSQPDQKVGGRQQCRQRPPMEPMRAAKG
jgi:hypothetical protein